MELSDVDKDIINLLMVDGRISLRQISQKLGKSISTIQSHYTELVNQGMIKGFFPLIDHSKFPHHVAALIGIKVGGGKLVEVEEKLSKSKHVLAVYDVTGVFDAFIFARFNSTTELNTFVKSALSIPHVKETNTFVVLNTVKEDFRQKIE